MRERKGRKWKIRISVPAFCEHSPDAMKKLNGIADCKRIKIAHDMSGEQILSLISDADAVVAGSQVQFNDEVLRRASQLKVVARWGVGVDNVDVDAATREGVIATYTPHANKESVAEHTFALILSLMRRTKESDAAVRQGLWSDREKLVGSELSAKTLGILGLGAIGRRVAEIASKGFNAKVVAHDPYVPPQEMARMRVESVGIRELFERSDVVTIHTALTRETRNMVNDELLSKAKKGLLLVNTARGQVIDERSLIKALESGRIGGAALDVYGVEPPSPDNPLLQMKNTILTPHIASFTREAVRRMDKMVVEDLLDAYEGRKPRGTVNPDVSPKRS